MVKIFGPLGSHDASGNLRAPPVYSSSLRNRQDREAPPAPPPPPAYDFEVTGAITPDATGYYSAAGVHNGRPYYARADNAYFLSYHQVYTLVYAWDIGPTLAPSAGPCWEKSTSFYTPPPGVYFPFAAPAAGAAFVTAP